MKNENRFESNKSATTAPPAIELLSDPGNAAKSWPTQIASDNDFMTQLETRKELNERLDTVISALPRPDISLQDAIEQNLLNEQQVTELYSSLTPLLEGDSEYKRLALYLPFEFLPNEDWEPSSEDLKAKTERFKQAYMATWEDLLYTLDVRANFVDGDVLEVESRDGDLPRVAKAAHLIPKLVEKGLLDTDEVLKLWQENDDPTLKQSIQDTLPVLVDMKLMKESDLPDSVAMPKVETRKTKPFSAEELTTTLNAIDAEKYDEITAKREAWLKKDKKLKAIELAGDDLQAAIESESFKLEDLEQLSTPESQQALVSGIRKAIEAADPKQAQALYDNYQETLLAFWLDNAPDMKNQLSKTFFQLNKLGIVSDEQLDSLGLKVPALAGPFSENLLGMEQEINQIQAITKAIEANPELAEQVYPIALVFGSRLKGYGTQDADIDIGLFVKPGVNPENKDQLREALKKAIPDAKMQQEVVEFWLEKTDQGLAVQDFDDYETRLGESSWTHVLFGAAWEGNQQAINEVREQLLTPYLYEDDKKLHGVDARKIYLEEMERDTLQYRLLHRGYEAYNPAFGGLRAEHSDLVDGKSTFWDSGYRQTATKLFTSRVFLPKVTKES
jgi:hypothetical protein